MTSKVCKKCSVEKLLSEFYTSKAGKLGVRSSCKLCDSHYYKLYKSTRKDQTRLYNEAWSKDNSDKKKLATKSWTKANYDKVLSYNASRRSERKLATLSGYCKEIEEIYWLARDLRTITGESYQVDHIVPLKGKNVCGLHVPWNLQILPADLNMSKGNRYEH